VQLGLAEETESDRLIAWKAALTAMRLGRLAMGQPSKPAVRLCGRAVLATRRDFPEL
jgi:hypothetical protein